MLCCRCSCQSHHFLGRDKRQSQAHEHLSYTTDPARPQRLRPLCVSLVSGQQKFLQDVLGNFFRHSAPRSFGNAACLGQEQVSSQVRRSHGAARNCEALSGPCKKSEASAEGAYLTLPSHALARCPGKNQSALNSLLR